MALLDLSTETHWNQTDNRGLTIATCIFCRRSLYKTKNTMHRCPELEQEVLTSENNGLSYDAFAFYAHDMLDAIEFDLEDKEQVPVMDEHDAATILNQRNYKNRNNCVEGSLGLVYAALDSSDGFLITQAVDR
ncbi:hypothetical protein BDC45DRAFT_571107 [Circinella umbellata]|nr:hypothetical protein BDC45DRAFT_571103 [Circinella umbellata]KAI7852512.1 hypothetical protein BDC45DRAFT_571107 [Circinella umbellata]